MRNCARRHGPSASLYNAVQDPHVLAALPVVFGELVLAWTKAPRGRSQLLEAAFPPVAEEDLDEALHLHFPAGAEREHEDVLENAA